MPANSFTQELIITARDNASQALNSASQSAQKAAGSIGSSGKAIEAVGQQTATTGQKFNNFGNSLKSNAGSITAVTGSAWGLFNAFDDMEKKVLSTNKAQTMAERSALMLSKAQQKLAAIASKQGKGSQEYATQLEVVRLAQDKATQSGEKAKIMAGDLQESYVQLAMTAGPQFAVLGGSIAQMVANFSRVGPAAKAGAAGLEVASTGMKSAGMASKLLHLALGPVGLVLLAIGTLFTLYATNAWGFADAVNGVAKSIMDGVGQIWGTIQKVGGQITSFLGALMKDIVSGNIPAALTRIRDLISGIFTEWVKPVFDKIYNFLLDKFSAIATAIGLPIDSAKKLLQGFVDFVFSIFGTLGEGITKAFDALASGNIIGAILAIQDMFNKLVLTVLEAMTVLFTESIPALLVALGGIILKEVSKWPKFIMDAFATLADWFATEGPKWLAGIGAAIAAEAPKWIAAIMDAFGKLGEFLKLEAMKIPENISASISFWNWDDAWKSLQDAFWSTVDFIATQAIALGKAVHDAIFNVDWPGVWQALQDAFWASVEFIGTQAVALGQAVYDALANVDWAGVWQALQDAFWSSVEFIGKQAIALGGAVRDAIVNVDWAGVWQALSDAFFESVKFIGEQSAALVKTLFEVFTGVKWDTALKGLQDAFDSSIKYIQGIFTWENIAKAFVPEIEVFSGIADAFQKSVIDPISKALDEWDVQQKFADIGKQITDAFNGAGVALGDFFANLGKVPQAEAEVQKGAEGLSFALWDVEAANQDAAKSIGNTVQAINPLSTAMDAAATAEAKQAAELRKLGAEANLIGEVMKLMAKDSVAALADLSNEGPRHMRLVTEAVREYGRGLISTLDETNLKIEAQKRFWASLPTAVKDYMLAVQAATLANINIRQSLEDTNFAQHMFNEGQIEGKSAVKAFVDEIAKEQGVFTMTMGALRGLADGHMALGDSLGWSQSQLEQFIGVVNNSPSAIIELGNAINELSNSTMGWVEQVKGDKQTVEDVFSDWKLTDAFPSEIRRIMSQGQQEFIAGKAQVTKVADEFMPAIANAFEMGARGINFAELQQLGPKAAAEIEAGFNGAVPPVLQKVVELLKNPPAGIKDGLPWMQQVITEFENAKNPMNAFIQQYLAVGGALSDVAPKLASSAEGLTTLFSAMDKGGDAGETLKTTVESLNKVVLDNGQTFAQLNGQMVEISPNAGAAEGGLTGLAGSVNPLNTAIQLAATTLQQFNAYLADAANMPKLQIDTSAVVTNLNSVITAINGIKQTTVPVIKVDTGAVATNLNSVQLAINGLKQAKAPIVTVTTAAGHKLVTKLQQAINAMKQNKAILISVNTQAATTAVNKLKSLVNAMPNIKRTITYTYKISGSRPNPPNLTRTITYRYQTVGSRPTSVGTSSLTNNTGPMIMPMTTGGSMTSGGGGFTGGGGGAGGQPTNFQGDVYFDTYRVGRVMGKAIAENNV